NMLTFTVVFVFINIFFLSVGALLYLYAEANGIDVTALRTPDHLFPDIALNHLSVLPAVIFMLGLTAATFATTDSALTALTTSFCVDFLGFTKKQNHDDIKLIRTRHLVHIGFSVVMLLVILVFRMINDDSVVNAIFKAAGYTYGPLLGLFVFGMANKRAVADKLVPYICIVSPILTYILDSNSLDWMGYAMGFELIVVNAAITFVLLLATSKPGQGVMMEALAEAEQVKLKQPTI
ncbi:MAG: sodium:solute symporter, partial [Hymenobacteraceae bacterium]|nr:sodium:solute symporter [Hymenobacteraceae bacterium]